MGIGAAFCVEIEEEAECQPAFVGIFLQVHAVACPPFVQRCGIEAGQGFGREAVVAILFIRIANDLEGEVGPAPDAERCRLEEAERRIEPDGLVVRQVRRGLHRQPVGVAMLPVFDFDDLQLTRVRRPEQPAFAVDHLRQLADGQSMQHGQGIHPDERLELRFPHRPIDEIVRVRTVEDDKLLPALRAGFHHEVHRADIGKEACANILDIKNDDIQVRQLLGRRLFVLSIEGDDGDARAQVFRVRYLGSRVFRAPKSMLGGKNLFHVDASFDQDIQDVLFPCVFKDRGLIDNQSHRLVPQQVRYDIDAFRPDAHRLVFFPGFRRKEGEEAENKENK